jgi:hypothetical protein
MATIFPLSASVGQEFDGYVFDGTIWNLIGNEYNPTSFSSTAPENPKPGDLWVDSITNVPVLSINNVAYQSDLNDYLTLQSASTNYATVDYVENELSNIDLNDAITTASAAAVSYLVDSAPEALDTLNELAVALGDDQNFATTITNSLSEKLSIQSASTTYLTNEIASNTYLTSASLQIFPVYKMNTGTTAERPASPTDGLFRFNTTTGYPEWYDPSENQWINFYQQKAFTLRYLIVAGGGGGGTQVGGGGGAGGLLSNTSSVGNGIPYTVSVGDGGDQSFTSTNPGSNGKNSIFSDLTAIGGGGGGSHQNNGVSLVGGSGGGGGGGNGNGIGGAAGTIGQGNSGGIGWIGWAGGGGGGAGTAGFNASNGIGGNGGNGLSVDITGSSVYYAGGGGGSSDNSNAGSTGGLGGGGNGRSNSGNGIQNGSPNTGGGGGGVRDTGAAGYGGSGIVIISYPSQKTINIGAGLTGTTTTVNANKVTTFTAGTGIVSFS